MKRSLPVLPVLASQCYSHGVDVDLNTRHRTSGSREPLKESTGNAQHNQLVRSASYDQRSEHHQHVYPIPPSLYLGQTLDFTTYGAAQYARSLLQQPQVQLHNTQGGRRGLGRNPFWQSPEFQAYRKRQAERESQGPQKWPEEAEEAFLDAFLLIPQIGKMKYSLRGKLNGRNMLIGEYIWLDYVANLPPGVQPDLAEKKGRKQVSSHIQVLKNFLSKHPYFHIFFPSYESRNGDKERENQYKESFKNHPVLIALTEQRLPDERPNYEYFSQILSMKDPIAIRPRRCWVFVSHRDVVVHEDGSGYLTSAGDRLAKGEFPHLKLNLEREKWSKEEQKEVKGVLLHEFTKDLSQFESSTVREISDLWEDHCPELHEKLEDIVATNPHCDMLHMHSTLELKEKCRFPGHSDLNSWVEITIEQPHLLNHRWKVETTLMRPPELSYSSEKNTPETIYRTSAKMSIQVEHRPGCDGLCGSGGKARDGISRCRKDYVIVPFPADVFALTLTNCAEYPAHPPHEVIRRGSKASKVVAVDDDDQDPDFEGAANSGDQTTQMDLVPKIAMMQELWSCPPEDPYGDDSQGAGGDHNKKGPRWERRGLILWTFQTIHSIEIDKKEKTPLLKTAPNGKTQWRFLQILDTASQYHQSRILVRGDGSGVGRYRDGGFPGRTGSYNPSVRLEQSTKHESRAASPLSMTYQHQPRSANTGDTFSATGWDLHGEGSLNSLSSSATQARAQAAYNTQLMLQTNHTGSMLDTFGGGGSGLATPPPSASLASSFATSFETASNDAADQITNYMASQVTSVDMAHSQQTTLGDLSAVTDPFLANSTASSFDATGAFDDPVSAHDDVSGWATSESTLPGANGGWSTGYSSTTPTTNGNYQHPGANVTHWVHGSSSAAGSNSIGRHYSQHATTQPPQLHLQTQGHHHGHHHPHHWVTDATDPEETGFWTPATSTDDALTSGIDAREQVIWAVSAQGIPNTTNDFRDAGDDWVHVQHQQQQQQQQDLHEEISGSEGGGGRQEENEILSASAELSQGWEEIVASAAAESQQSQSQSQSQFDSQGTIATTTSTTIEDDLLHASFPLSPFAAATTGSDLLDMSDSNNFTTQQQHRGQKRSRSDSTSQGSGGYYDDNEFGVAVAHHMHRSSQRTRLGPSGEAC